MDNLIKLGSIAGIAALPLLGLLICLTASPKPAVWLLRRGGDAAPEFLPDHEERVKKVRILRDLSYPSKYGKNQLDLYLPQTPGQKCPLILWAHGGAFVAGDKAGTENWAVSLASEGIAVASVNYQWAPEAHWPAQVCQMEEACRLLAGEAEKYGIDMTHVVVAGDSAGAHMAAQFALIHTSQAFREASGLAPVLEPGALKGVLLYCGPYDIGQMAVPKNRAVRFFMSRVGWSYLGKKYWQGTALAQLMTIRSFVTQDFPPAYITDGNAFSFEPQGRALAEALRQAGCMVRTRFWDAEAGEVAHEYQFAMAQPNAQLCYQDTVSFLNERKLLNHG